MRAQENYEESASWWNPLLNIQKIWKMSALPLLMSQFFFRIFRKFKPIAGYYFKIWILNEGQINRRVIIFFRKLIDKLLLVVTF